jgi:hypothetical protein
VEAEGENEIDGIEVGEATGVCECVTMEAEIEEVCE